MTDNKQAVNTSQGLSIILIVTALLVSSVALFVMLNPLEDDPEQIVNEPTVAPTLTLEPSLTPTMTVTPVPSSTVTPTPPPTELPTAQANIVETSVAQTIIVGNGNGEVVRGADPLTINQQLQRTEIVQYEVQYGDSLGAIAESFGLTTETIIWSNGTFYVNAMRPGMLLTILPVDGALHKTEDPITIADLAEEYDVEPYTAIINSDYNEFLRDATPDMILPEGIEVVIEGGTGSKEPVFWDPRGGAASTVDPSSSTGSVYQGTAHFGIGDPGSCGVQEIYDGTLPVVGPVSGYVLTTDFSWNHRGLDLSAREGTPVKAVGAGTVVFAGWSTWGYGYAIVVAHGPVMTLYAHLTGTGFVWCGKQVQAGEHIANVGSTGNSSGPHLHFEIRNAAGVPQNPRDYLTFAALR